MRTNYEIALNEFMPAFRAAAAEMLVNRYGIKQDKAARMLDVTQASISKYLNGKSSRAVHDAGASIDRRHVEEFVARIMSHRDGDAQKAICKACQRYNSFDCTIMVK